MYPIMLAQWMKERRSPYMLLLFIGISLAAALLFGGIGKETVMKVGVYHDASITTEAADKWLERLNHKGTFAFILQKEETARRDIQEGRSKAAVVLRNDGYRLIAATEDYQVEIIEKLVNDLYRKELQLQAVADQSDDPKLFRARAEQFMGTPPLTWGFKSTDGGELQPYNMPLQLMYTFALFLVMFTIGFKLSAINAEKVSGIWSRMILSPVHKSQIYLGHLIYGAGIGFIQVLVVYGIFWYLFGYEFGDRPGLILLVTAVYILGVVALATLFTGITRTPEQFNSIYPSIIPVIPLISGAYMPPGTITNKFLLTIAEVFPLYHALQAIMGVAMYDYGWSDLFLPLAKLLVITVLFMGVGINLVERGRRA